MSIRQRAKRLFWIVKVLVMLPFEAVGVEVSFWQRTTKEMRPYFPDWRGLWYIRAMIITCQAVWQGEIGSWI